VRNSVAQSTPASNIDHVAIERREKIDLIILTTLFGIWCLASMTGVVTWVWLIYEAVR
jgi:hypothetical protein